MNQRTIVISGGSRGLGLELVAGLLDGGHRVATFSRSDSEGLATLRSTKGDRLFYRQLDATNSGGVTEFVGSVAERFGRLDALINNAGIAREGVLATMSDSDISSLLQVNLLGTMLLTRECVRLMLLNQGPPSGRVVNISSIVGLRGYSGLSGYSATKAALIGLTASLARELGPRKITVNAVAPGFLDTEMTSTLSESQKAQIVRRTPLGRLGRPADVLNAVRFLLSPEADFITGQTITIDGGLTC